MFVPESKGSMHVYLVLFRYLSSVDKRYAPGEDRTHDLQITLCECDYETDALPTALPRHTLGQVWKCSRFLVITQTVP